MNTYKVILLLIGILFLVNITILFEPDRLEVSDRAITQHSPGIIFTERTILVKNKPVTISYFSIDPKVASIGIVTPEILEKKSSNTKYSAYSLEEYATRGGYKLTQSGGFLSSWSPPLPLGYVKSRGEEYNKVHDTWITKGVFCTNGDTFSIDEYNNPEQFDDWLSCLQAGPLISLDKKVVLNTQKHTWYVTGDKHRQSFLCSTQDNHLIMGIIEDVALKDLASVLVEEEDSGLGCINSLLLMSKGVSGIHSNNDNVPSIGSTNVPLPNAIVIK